MSTEENFSILFDEDRNFVEIKYQGVNAAHLAQLQLDFNELESTVDAAMAGVNGQLGTLANDLDSLSSITSAQGNALVDEIALRLAGDTLLGEQTLEITGQLADAIESETEARGAAILAEAEARNAAIASANAIIVTDVAALAVSVTGLATDMGVAQASIIEVSEALSTEVSARSAQYSAIQADFEDTNAAVLEESLARSDGDGALAAQITAITATSWRRSFQQPEPPDPEETEIDAGDVWWDSDDGNASYRYDGTNWVSVDNPQIEANTASITAEAIARASADSTMASNITTLFATTGGLTSSLATEASVRAGADGTLNARYGVKVNVNGHVAGFGLNATANNDTSFSEFVISADSFKVFNGTSPVAPFQVIGGIVYMTNVKVGSIESLTSTTGSLSVNGNLTMSSTGAIRGGKSSFGDPTNGFWMGYESGAYKFSFGNSTNNISWDGTNLLVTGQIINTGNIAANAVTQVVESHYSWGTSAPYDTSWNGTYASFHPSGTGHVVTIDLGGASGTKYVRLDLTFTAARDGGDDDNIGLYFFDATAGAFVGSEARDVQLFGGYRLYSFSQVFETTATGNRTYTVRAKSFRDGSPYVSYVQFTGQVFKK